MPHPAPQDRAMRRPVSTTLAAGVQPTEPGTFDVRPRTPATPDEVHDQGFGRFPLPVWDIILSSQQLSMRDHLALSGSCRALRACYDDHVWLAVLGRRPMRNHGAVEAKRCFQTHWPRPCAVDTCVHVACTCETILGRLATSSAVARAPLRPSPKRAVIATIHDPHRTLSLTEASRLYGVRRDQSTQTLIVQVSSKQMRAKRPQNLMVSQLPDFLTHGAMLTGPMPAVSKVKHWSPFRHPRAPADPLHVAPQRSSLDPRAYKWLEATVESVALREHGGPDGHNAYMRQLATRRTNDTSKDPRRANRPHHRRIYPAAALPVLPAAAPTAAPPAPPIVPGPTLVVTAVQLGAPGPAPPPLLPPPGAAPAAPTPSTDGVPVHQLHVHSTNAPEHCRGARRRRGPPQPSLPLHASPSGFPAAKVECRVRKLTTLEGRVTFET